MTLPFNVSPALPRTGCTNKESMFSGVIIRYGGISIGSEKFSNDFVPLRYPPVSSRLRPGSSCVKSASNITCIPRSSKTPLSRAKTSFVNGRLRRFSVSVITSVQASQRWRSTPLWVGPRSSPNGQEPPSGPKSRRELRLSDVSACCLRASVGLNIEQRQFAVKPDFRQMSGCRATFAAVGSSKRWQGDGVGSAIESCFFGVGIIE